MPEPKTKAEALNLRKLYKERAARNHAKAVKFAQYRDADLAAAAKYSIIAEDLLDFEAELNKLYKKAQAKFAEESGGPALAP
ncbi:hypothetical protein TrVFT333_010284 [Trichoderma virens FT-333]|nr:hypothetical protein TrVFT333_010284 [Trichoderma virens FT-333]